MLIVSLSAIGCGEVKKEDKGNAEAIAGNLIKLSRTQFEENDMDLGSIQEKEFPVIVNATGIIDVPPENRSVVSATMGGYVKTMPLLVGDVVRKGQLLLTIENPEFVTLQQQYMEVSGQLGYLKSEFDRQKTMYDERISSQKSYLKAESEYKTARARYEGLQKQLTMLNIAPENVEAGKVVSIVTIYAPISGSVTKVNVTKGSYVAPATSIMEIIDNDHIHLELSVFEKDIIQVKKGQYIRFRIPEASKDTFEAEVFLVGTSIGEGRTVKVHGHLKNKEKNNFLPGMFVETNIITDKILAQALPDESVVNIGVKNYVLVLAKEANGNYYFQQVEVQSTDSYKGFSKIENGNEIKNMGKILIRGAFNLLGE
jgi:cobalt-zinc-cadmium efflux system membrane fusion protein